MFRDAHGNSLFIGGDIKTIKLSGDQAEADWDAYHEYHMEFESMTYRELYGSASTGSTSTGSTSTGSTSTGSTSSGSE